MKLFNNKSFLFFLGFFLIFLFPSCFEIVEEVNLNDDGSGTFCYTINMSQSKLQINSMFLLDSINGRPMPKKDDLAAAFDKVEKTLKEENDISNIITKRNWDDYIFSVSGNFINVEALNKAINKINTVFNQPGKYSTVIQDNYSYSDKVFTRLYNYNLINEYNSMSEKDKAVFNNAKYTTIYRFLNPVVSYTNPNAMKSKNGKAIMLKVNVKDLITNSKTIKNSINLK
jgi:hypothetical protein